MAKDTLTRQIAAEISRQISDGILKTGDPLPSLRKTMQQRAVSKNTVITAYEMLASQGLVEARHGKGFLCGRAARRRPRMMTCSPTTARWTASG